MNSTDLSFFSAVAGSGAIGRAALELNTVQSNVTQRIQALEAQLGAKLFDRSKKGVTLTAAGRLLAPYATRIAELLAEAQHVVQDQAEPAGELRVGCLETTAALRLPALVGAFAAACPKVDLGIETGPTQDLVDRVLARRLDGAFVTGPIRHAALVATPMVDEELVLVAPPGIATRKQLQAHLAAGSVRALVFRAGCSYRQRTSEVLSRRGCVDIRLMEMGTLDGIIGCIAGAVGVALLPRGVVASAAALGRVALHGLDARERAATTVFVVRRDAFMFQGLRRFIALAKDTLSVRDTPSHADRAGGRRKACAARA